MFNLNTDGLSGREIDRIRGQFKSFVSDEGLLPSFAIDFYDFVPSEKDINGKFLADINSHLFYSDDDGYYIFYGSSAERRVGIFIGNDYSHAKAFYNEHGCLVKRSDVADLLYHGYRYRAVTTGNMMIHSAAAVYNNEAILFCGMHEAGKSTQANLWVEHKNAEVINYDSPCIIRKDGELFVHGTPWSGKEGVYKNEYAPLKAIVFVEKSDINEAIKVSKAEAFSLIYLNNYLYPLDNKIEEQYFNVIEKIASEIPVFRLKCTISEDAVTVLYNELY